MTDRPVYIRTIQYFEFGNQQFVLFQRILFEMTVRILG
jgi:hypothetical protein